MSTFICLFFRANKALERFERRILDEFIKLFNDTDSFYFSYSGDLTNTLQRQMSSPPSSDPLWKLVDDRFFFNRHLLRDLIELNDSRADPFILPVIQGYVQIIYAPLNLAESDSFFSNFSNSSGGGGGGMLSVKTGSGLPDFYSVALVSRRGRDRAGEEI